MTLTKRIVLLYRTFKLIPKLESLEKTVPTLEALDYAIGQLEALERFLPRLASLENLFVKVEQLDYLVKRLEELNEPVVAHTNGKALPQPTPDQTVRDYRRLKLLMKFSHLQGKAQFIEQEWQKIQQEAHDASFYNQVYLGKAEAEVAQKDGFQRGIKWCIEHFS